MAESRIVSFLPAATEMVCALGLADHLVGITHECDYPPDIRDKPIVVRNALPLEGMSPREIDVTVSERIRSGASLYQVDERLLQEVAPNLILTQNLCQVCAPSGNEITQVLKALRPVPKILWFTPKSLAGIEENLRELGKATGRSDEAKKVISAGRARLEKVTVLTGVASTRPRVFCMEWVDPVYCSGHWVPEMVELAGGVDALSRKGTDSVRMAWEDVVNWGPEVLIISPCGFDLAGASEQALQLFARPGWKDLPAVRQNRVYAVDANSYFARPGPRVVAGVELLAHLIHPELCEWGGAEDAFQCIHFAVSNKIP
ncbi:MAG TPA: cobalamin-binding protein [Candidatus Acidoferrum sp.]|jgi:iron complex transport system substrate-binding protein|nr:cobalamin-binding protein [Candidatus Acidoferrum sp.]